MSDLRVATWDSVGYNVENAKDLEQVLTASGLDYDVVKKPVFTRDNAGHDLLLPNRFVTTRPEEDGTLHTYDVVSDKFEVVQNRDAFDFVNFMGSDVKFVKAGETKSGMVFIIGALPEVNILGDAFTPYVLFRNGFSGKVKITACICPLRIVCQNQFNFSFNNAQNAVTVRHVRNAEAKLEEAKQVLKMSADYMVRLNEEAEKYASLKMNEFQIKRVTDMLFPIPKDANEVMNAFKLKRLEEQRARFISAHNADDNANFRNTAWGLINAYTDFITHEPAMGKTETKTENKFINITFKPNTTGRIIDIINEVYAA